MSLEQQVYAAACRIRDRKAATWRVERLALDAAIAEATAAKQPMVGDYWQHEWRAREVLKSAERMVEILTPGVP